MGRSSVTYTNPILPGFYPDPSITRAGDDYYLICSSFEYFPGIPIFQSRDLVHWTQIGHVLDRMSQLDTRERASSDGIYAPTIRYQNGIFYVITTDVRGIGNFYVTASDPAGPWSDPIRIPHDGIDPSLMFDDDGKVYVTAQRGADYDSHVIQFEVDIATGQPLSEPVVIWTGDGGPWTEGPHLYKIKGMYYIMTASGGTAKEHREIIGRSLHPYGPFERWEQPILTHNRIDHPIQYLGHADLIEDGHGDWWAVFLGVRLTGSGYSVLGRETFLAPVQWNEEGWPMIDNNEGTVRLEMTVPSVPANLPESMYAACAGKDEFDGEQLHPSWTFLRNPAPGSWSLSERPGWLCLRGRASGLQEIGQVAFAGKRQQGTDEEWSTRLEFNTVRDDEEAGLCARRDEEAHYEICLKQKNGQRFVAAHLTAEGQMRIAAEVPCEADTVYLKVKAEEAAYGLLYSFDGLEWTLLARGEAFHLSPEAASTYCFTGVVMGLYATGHGEQCAAPAYFDWFERRIAGSR